MQHHQTTRRQRQNHECNDRQGTVTQRTRTRGRQKARSGGESLRTRNNNTKKGTNREEDPQAASRGRSGRRSRGRRSTRKPTRANRRDLHVTETRTDRSDGGQCGRRGGDREGKEEQGGNSGKELDGAEVGQREENRRAEERWTVGEVQAEERGPVRRGTDCAGTGRGDNPRGPNAATRSSDPPYEESRASGEGATARAGRRPPVYIVRHTPGPGRGSGPSLSHHTSIQIDAVRQDSQCSEQLMDNHDEHRLVSSSSIRPAQSF
ncbi:unnamed protein product [Lota lota]